MLCVVVIELNSLNSNNSEFAMRRVEMPAGIDFLSVFLDGDFIAFCNKREMLWLDSRDGKLVVKSGETDVATVPEKGIIYIKQA